MGQHWHFDIAIDAMSTSQYNTFFESVTDGSNWYQVNSSKSVVGVRIRRRRLRVGGVLVGERIMRRLPFVRVRGFRKEESILRVERKMRTWRE
jgi:hypothetical protein